MVDAPKRRAKVTIHRVDNDGKLRLGTRITLVLAGVAAACSLLAPPDAEYLGGGASDDAGGQSGGPAGTTAGHASSDGGSVALGGETNSAPPPAGMGGEEAAGAAGQPNCPKETPTRCDSECVDLVSDSAHCGDCGVACPHPMSCRAGVCACGEGHHACAGTCARNDSVDSCGDRCVACSAPDGGHATCDGVTCGVACDVGFSPCETACIDFRTDRNNCGGCGAEFACSGDAVCQAGHCVSVSGCSDGTREGFDVPGAYLAIAGCNADWPMGSMRATKTGVPCGVGLAVCVTPADACGAGWHVCAAPPYGPSEVSARATLAECLAQSGAFAAAVGDQDCEPCSADGAGAACCGNECVQQNGSCIYPQATPWFGVISEHANLCGEIESTGGSRGVLCCLDS